VSVRRSVSLSVCLSVTRLNSSVHAVRSGSFGAAFAKSFWPLVFSVLYIASFIQFFSVFISTVLISE